MDKLEKLVWGRTPATKYNQPLVIDHYNILVDKINELIDTPIITSSALLLCTKTITLGITENQTTVLGSTFTPPITKEPSIIDAYILGEKITQTNGYILNGNYYDILLAGTETELVNLKINVLCQNI